MKTFFRLFFIFSIVVVSMAGIVWFFGWSFLQKYTPYKDEVIVLTSSVIDDNKGIFIIAHIGSEVLQPSLMMISGETMVTVPNGYGEYKLGAVLPLLNLDGKSANYKRAVFTRILGVPVSSFLVVSEPIDNNNLSRLRRLLRLVAIKKLLNFTLPWKIVAVLPLLQQYSPNKQVFSLEEAQSKLQTSLVRSVSRSELACTLAIVNTTEQSGLARQLATTLEKSGVRVVRISDSSQLKQHSQLLIDPNRKECTWISPLVATWFFSDLELIQVSNEESEYRSWGVVFIGSDAY